MKTLISSATLLAFLCTVSDAHAVCGDVTGDGNRSATDALAILKASTGQQIDLVCDDSGPSRLRYYNDFNCNSGSSLSTAMFNGFEFTADGGATSEYQEVDRTQIDTIEIDICGLDFEFSGPLNLPPNRSITFFVSFLDPDIYNFAAFPALITLVDDGLPAALTMDAESGLPLGSAGYLLGGYDPD